MSNESTSYVEFLDRIETLNPACLEPLSEIARDHVIAHAWEECAWVSTLTDQRIIDALEHRAERQA